PTLVQAGNILSTGEDFTSNGPLTSFIAQVLCDIGGCGLNGEGCTLVEGDLTNEGNSAADISLVPPHVFSVTSGFGYFNGCDGTGEDCTSADCPGAFTDATNGAIVSCTAPNVDLAITFCD
ncbi:hypothetical protein SISNIDRAFT_406534, partial [Sistotremastrum niveocremeum HHB9708]